MKIEEPILEIYYFDEDVMTTSPLINDGKCDKEDACDSNNIGLISNNT